MIRACNKNGVQLFVSFMHRYLLGIEQTRRLLQEKAIGTVQMVRVLNAPGATSTVSKWFYDKENVGGGCVIDIGVHGIDLVRYLIGEIEEVTFADMGRFRDTIVTEGEEVHPNNEDHATVVYKTDTGATVDDQLASLVERRSLFHGDLWRQGLDLFERPHGDRESMPDPAGQERGLDLVADPL